MDEPLRTMMGALNAGVRRKSFESLYLMTDDSTYAALADLPPAPPEIDARPRNRKERRIEQSQQRRMS